jgi:hypothetical protein
MTFDRDFRELVESESRLSAPLADSNKAGNDFRQGPTGSTLRRVTVNERPLG